ncbi:MAG: hypothetical protein K2O70_01140, partial [Desulfovibrionaceae bacterium]|nr:hypothetical protein [Desulfovibrionaceae bacterium]
HVIALGRKETSWKKFPSSPTTCFFLFSGAGGGAFAKRKHSTLSPQYNAVRETPHCFGLRGARHTSVEAAVNLPQGPCRSYNASGREKAALRQME